MKAAVDLHIHTALSPCSDNAMTPNNIVNMAYLKGLDIIAITDHNSAENCEAVLKCAQSIGITVIPGMEIETQEEVHLICLFPSLDAVLQMQEKVYEALPPLENREDIFGQQLVMDEEDNIRYVSKRLLITATCLSIDDVFNIVGVLGGIVIPAHVDRESYSIISNLGSIPEELRVRYLEVSSGCDPAKFLQNNKQLLAFDFIRSSDAHYLENILERESFIDIESMSAKGLIRALNSYK